MTFSCYVFCPFPPIPCRWCLFPFDSEQFDLPRSQQFESALVKLCENWPKKGKNLGPNWETLCRFFCWFPFTFDQTHTHKHTQTHTYPKWKKRKHKPNAKWENESTFFSGVPSFVHFFSNKLTFHKHFNVPWNWKRSSFVSVNIDFIISAGLLRSVRGELTIFTNNLARARVYCLRLVFLCVCVCFPCPDILTYVNRAKHIHASYSNANKHPSKMKPLRLT